MAKSTEQKVVVNVTLTKESREVLAEAARREKRTVANLARVLIEPGDVVALEEPGYLGAQRTFAAHGADLRAIAVDPDGIRVDALERYDRFYGDGLKVEYPTNSGAKLTLGEIAQDLRRRMISIFLVGPNGLRPCFGGTDKLQHDTAWKDNLLFNEYFHGDNGAGLGASHQTGWTGIVADAVLRVHGAVESIGDVLRDVQNRVAPR